MGWNLIASGEHVGAEAEALFEDLKAVFQKWAPGLREAGAVLKEDGETGPVTVSLLPPPPEPAAVDPNATPATSVGTADATTASRVTALESDVSEIKAGIAALLAKA